MISWQQKVLNVPLHLSQYGLVLGLCCSAALVSVAKVDAAELDEGVYKQDAATSSANVDMADYYDLIYQIRVVARNAGSKSSIGSGFQVSADGLIITNYHVVSMAVDSPETHNIEYLDQAGNSGPLQLLDFDVVNDLAVLRHPAPAARHFEIAGSQNAETVVQSEAVEVVNDDPISSAGAGVPSREVNGVEKGDMIYALGNPHDLGITLKLGAFNGIVEHSYNPQILFSGSLNPGMSGGPGLLANGSVIGVNVATAGSDLSFLVPASAMLALIDAGRTLSPEDYLSEIASQVLDWQERRYGDLLAKEWNRVAFGDWPALDEIRFDMQCWGSSNEDEDDLSIVVLSKGCDSGNRLYLGSGFNTGHIHYSFFQRRSVKLSPLRFHATTSNSMYPDNSGDDTKLSGFDCQSGFVNVVASDEAVSSGSVTTSLCIRAYVELPDLFDVLLLATQGTDTESYTAHFALAGVPKDLADQFTRKFFATLGWQ